MHTERQFIKDRCQGRSKLDNWGADIHIFGFCEYMNISPSVIELATALDINLNLYHDGRHLTRVA